MMGDPSEKLPIDESHSELDSNESDLLLDVKTSRSSPPPPPPPPPPPVKSRRRRSWAHAALILLAAAAAAFFFTDARGLVARVGDPTVPPDGLSPPWYPSPRGGTAKSWAESYDKAARMVRRMTLPEKVNITTGTGWMMGPSVGNTGPAVHVGFPALALQDGPLGLRFSDNSTAFPAGITVGATWNKELMYARGRAHGLEARLKGINVLLGPSVGALGRMPAGGRNWEGFGSDPYLQGIAGAQTVRGIQSRGVMATIKHLVANEQEHFRQSWEWGIPGAVSANVPDRAMHEVYAWPFADAVRAGVASVMCSYNMVNNSAACANSKLLNGILKDEMGFQGFVMSDWLAQRSGVASALAGLDMSMPGDGLVWARGDSLWGPRLTEAVLNGSVPVERLDDMATRIVASWYQLGQDDEELFDRRGPNFSSWTWNETGVAAPGSPTDQDRVRVNHWRRVQGDHHEIARQVAVEGTVLLKNDGGILPLRRDGARAGKKEKTTRIGIFGEDAGPGNGPNFCKDRGCNQGTLGSGWGSGAVEFPYLVSPVEALEREFDRDHVELTLYLSNELPSSSSSSSSSSSAAAAAAAADDEPSPLHDQDICIVFGNADAGEGFLTWSNTAGDRSDLFLQLGADALVRHVAENCGAGRGETVVVVHAVGPVVMDNWIDLPGVRAVVLANLPGQESGNALADVLFGDVNPSGKLPYTIGRSLADYGPAGQVMYRPNHVIPQQNFDEELYIDYRHFDRHGIEPRFEFGHGLSYTRFEFSNVAAAQARPKSALPSPRPDPARPPPAYDTAIPDPREALFPKEIRRLAKYVYPYLDSVDSISSSSSSPSSYPYPDGYHTPAPLSPAGGDVGGNPDLWETYVRVTVDVANVGDVRGKVVAQLYLSYPESDDGPDFPVRVLRGFEKVELDRGEKKTVEFALTRRDLSYWDVGRQNWVMVTEGQYKFVVGESSRDGRAEVRW